MYHFFEVVMRIELCPFCKYPKFLNFLQCYPIIRILNICYQYFQHFLTDTRYKLMVHLQYLYNFYNAYILSTQELTLKLVLYIHQVVTLNLLHRTAHRFLIKFGLMNFVDRVGYLLICHNSVSRWKGTCSIIRRIISTHLGYLLLTLVVYLL